MWIRDLFMGFVGLTAGIAVSAGVFGFIVVLGVIPRITGKTHTSRSVLTYENTIFLGGMFGNLLAVFKISLGNIFPMPLETGFLCIFGWFAGMYVGCLAIALAEMLDAFPIMFRRAGIKIGLGWTLIGISLGKVIGSLYYYANHMAS